MALGMGKKRIVIGAGVLCLLIAGIFVYNGSIEVPGGKESEPGENPTLTVVVKHPPEELYYLDLLIPDNDRMLMVNGFVGRKVLDSVPTVDEIRTEMYSNGWVLWPDAKISEVPRIDDEVKRLLYGYDEWVPAVIDRGIQGGPSISAYSGKQQGDDMVHVFGYIPPRTFRVMMITENYEVRVSDVYEVTESDSLVEFDWHE